MFKLVAFHRVNFIQAKIDNFLFVGFRLRVDKSAHDYDNSTENKQYHHFLSRFSKKEFKESVKHGNRKKEKQKEPSETVSDAPKEPIKEEVSYIEPIKQKETVVPKQENTEPVVKQEPKMESELMQMLYPVSPQEIEKKEVKNMATIIGAGKYVFGENIPMGQYDLKAVSGKGTLKIQIGEGDDFDDKWQNMGYNVKGFAETYSGLTLPKGWFFAIDGDLKCEITKSKMLEIE